jgi:hypothetical protein
VVNHRENLSRGNAVIEDDGVPVLLVHVIAGADTLVSLAQLNGKLRVALEVDTEWTPLQPRQQEHLAVHLENKNIFPERELLRNLSAFSQAVFPDGFNRQSHGFSSGVQ